MTKRVAARAHGIEFTDDDWRRITLEAEQEWNIAPSAFVNKIIGEHFKRQGWQWDGLTTHGGRREGAGRKKVKKVILDNQDAT